MPGVNKMILDLFISRMNGTKRAQCTSGVRQHASGQLGFLSPFEQNFSGSPSHLGPIIIIIIILGPWGPKIIKISIIFICRIKFCTEKWFFYKFHFFIIFQCFLMFFDVCGAPMGPWDPWDQYNFFLKNRIFMVFLDVGQYFAYKRYFNTIIGPWDLSRIVDNGRLYILIEYNVFWTDLARSGPGRPGSGPGLARVRSGNIK